MMASNYDLYPDPKLFLLLDSESTNKITIKLQCLRLGKVGGTFYQIPVPLE